MFPEVNSGDSTHGTNKYERIIYIGCKYISDLVSNPHIYFFLPSGRRWIFNWIVKYATPMLHGRDTCRKTVIHLF